MPITVHIYYRGEHGAARRFAQEMLASGTAAAVLFAPSHVLLSYLTEQQHRHEHGHDGVDIAQQR